MIKKNVCFGSAFFFVGFVYLPSSWRILATRHLYPLSLAFPTKGEFFLLNTFSKKLAKNFFSVISMLQNDLVMVVPDTGDEVISDQPESLDLKAAQNEGSMISYGRK